MYTAQGTLEREPTLERFAPLVKRLAHHLVAKLPPSVQVDDLIQAGLIGLVDAIGRFEHGLGAQFETYATQRIRGAMLDELRAHDWLPRGLRRAQKQIETASARLEQRLGRPPSEPEIAAEMGLPLGDYQRLLDEAHGAQILHYEDFVGEDGDERLLEREARGEDATPERTLEDSRFRGALVAAIEALPEREKLVMSLYYERDLNFREIGAVLGVSESRVCQLHGQVVARLRGKLIHW
jgi:RNA polymerase sigma factor for flagellar operon FliA